MTDDRIQEIAGRTAARIRLNYTDEDGIVRVPYDRFDEVAANLIAVALREAERGRWVSVDERLPEPGVPVLIYVTNTRGFHRRLRAEWSDGKSLPVEYDAPLDFGVYDEATDTIYCPEGWYESNEYEETHWAVTDHVSHWRPLPAPPEVEP